MFPHVYIYKGRLRMRIRGAQGDIDHEFVGPTLNLVNNFTAGPREVIYPAGLYTHEQLYSLVESLSSPSDEGEEGGPR